MTKKPYQPVSHYHIADPSFWPMIGTLGLFTTVIGFVQTLHDSSIGPFVLAIGLGIILYTMFGWFKEVIHESVSGLHSKQMDRTYRWAMLWFIVSEIFLFSIFFFALFYTRLFTVTELGNSVGPLATKLLLSNGPYTHDILWPKFVAEWPLLKNPNPELFVGPKQVVETWGIPALNTLILLSSALTLTWSHWGFKKDNRGQVVLGLVLTVLLGLIFESFQVHEYIKAYTEYGLTLNSGIYGSTFFMLTGLHAWHVTIGIIMLTIILLRVLKGHFSSEHHFGFEAVAWYWHMVDVVWLFLFVFVYWL